MRLSSRVGLERSHPGQAPGRRSSLTGNAGLVSSRPEAPYGCVDSLWGINSRRSEWIGSDWIIVLRHGVGWLSAN